MTIKPFGSAADEDHFPQSTEDKLREQVADKSAEVIYLREQLSEANSCIEELEIKLEVAEGERDITLKNYIALMDRIFGLQERP